MTTTNHQHRRFQLVLQALIDWHVDSVAAASFEGPGGSPNKPGAKHFAAQSYPGVGYWMRAWRDSQNRDEVIAAMEEEYAALSRRSYRLEQYRDTWGKTRYRKAARD